MRIGCELRRRAVLPAVQRFVWSVRWTGWVGRGCVPTMGLVLGPWPVLSPASVLPGSQTPLSPAAAAPAGAVKPQLLSDVRAELLLTLSFRPYVFCFLLFRLLNPTKSKKANHIHLFFVSCTKALKGLAYLIFSLLFIFILKYWAVFYPTVFTYQLTKPVFSLFLLLPYNLLHLEKQLYRAFFQTEVFHCSQELKCSPKPDVDRGSGFVSANTLLSFPSCWRYWWCYSLGACCVNAHSWSSPQICIISSFPCLGTILFSFSYQ